jgi:nucleoside-diphosphate-sugar epimerase
MKNILILGSEGYLGSVLVPFLLRKNLKITGIDKCFFGRKNKYKKNFQFIKNDYKNIKNDFLTKFDFIIDLVNISNDPASELNFRFTTFTNYKNKIIFYKKLLQVNKVIKYIYISSCSVYGHNTSLVNESSKPQPISLYSKLCLKYENFLKKNKINYTVLRLGTLYGWSKRMRYDIAINKIIRDIIFLKKIEILGGQQQRFFCYNIFACEVISKIIFEKTKKFINKIFNIGIFNTNIIELTKKIINLTNAKNTDIIHEKNNIDKRSYKVSMASANLFKKKSSFSRLVNNSLIATYKKISLDKIPFDKKKITLLVYKDYLKKKYFKKNI